MAYIDPSLARGYAKELLRGEADEIKRKMGRISVEANQGSQRDGPVFKRLVKQIESGFADRMLLAIDCRPNEDARIYYILYGVDDRQEPRARVIGVVLRKKKAKRMDVFPVPLIIYRHVIERLILRTGHKTFKEFTPELAAALNGPLQLHLQAKEWPHLYAENGSYCLPSPSGAFFGEKAGTHLKILTFVDNDKFTDTQRARHDTITQKIIDIMKETSE